MRELLKLTEVRGLRADIIGNFRFAAAVAGSNRPSGSFGTPANQGQDPKLARSSLTCCTVRKRRGSGVRTRADSVAAVVHSSPE